MAMAGVRGSAYPGATMRARSLAALCALSVASAAACGPPPGDGPLSPAERSRLIDDYVEGQRVRSELGGGGPRPQCASSTGPSRLEGRRTRYAAVEGFDTRSCPP